MIDYLSKDKPAGKITSLITAISIGTYALGVGGCASIKCIDNKPKQDTGVYTAHEDYNLLKEFIDHIYDSKLNEPTEDIFTETLGKILWEGYTPQKQGTDKNPTTKTLLDMIGFVLDQDLSESTSKEYSEALNNILINGFPAQGKVRLQYTEAEQDSTNTCTTPKDSEKEKLTKKFSKPNKLEKEAATADTIKTKSKEKDYDAIFEDYEGPIIADNHKPPKDNTQTIPDLSEKPDSTKVELTEKPEGVSETHWYNEGIFANTKARWAAAGLVSAGLTYLIGDNNDWFQDDNGKGPIGPEPGVTGGRGDSISDTGTVRGGRGDKSGSDSGGNR